MNRTMLVAATTVVAAGTFVAAVLLVPSDQGSSIAVVAPVDEAVTDAEMATATELLVRPHSPVLGDPDAPVTVVEFFDPACEACRAFHPTVKQLLMKNPAEVRVVMRYAAFHEDASEKAIAVLEAARGQNLFEPVLDALLERQGEWASHDTPAAERTLVIAAEAGLDIETARSSMMSPMTVGIIKSDRADLEAVGVRGTPTFFVNGKPLQTFGRQELVEAVEGAIKTVRAE